MKVKKQSRKKYQRRGKKGGSQSKETKKSAGKSSKRKNETARSAGESTFCVWVVKKEGVPETLLSRDTGALKKGISRRGKNEKRTRGKKRGWEKGSHKGRPTQGETN